MLHLILCPASKLATEPAIESVYQPAPKQATKHRLKAVSKLSSPLYPKEVSQPVSEPPAKAAP
jgi:hypothetical protein